MKHPENGRILTKNAQLKHIAQFIAFFVVRFYATSLSCGNYKRFLCCAPSEYCEISRYFQGFILNYLLILRFAQSEHFCTSNLVIKLHKYAFNICMLATQRPSQPISFTFLFCCRRFLCFLAQFHCFLAKPLIQCH